MNILNIYLKDVRRRKQISRDKEIELSERVLAGGDDALKARNELVEANLRLAITIAREYKGCGLEEMDLIQEANIGLIMAAERYDWQWGKFSSYAQYWIRKAIFEALSNYGCYYHMPANKYPILYLYNGYKEKYFQKHGTYPTISMFLKKFDIDEKGAGEFIAMNEVFESLDAPVGEEKKTTLADTLGETDDSSYLDNPVLTDIIRHKLLRIMDLDEHQALLAWFGFDNESKVSLAHKLGCSEETIKQRKDRALSKIQNSPEARMLKAIFNE